MSKFQPPKEFDFVPEKWAEWASRYERFRVISKAADEEEVFQVNSFLYAMGSDSESIFDSLTLTNDQRQSYNAVKTAFDNYFSPKKYIIFERAKFFRRDQREGETVEQYVRALNELASKCEFQNRSEQMRDRIVVGISDTSVSRDMQKMDVTALTESVAINMARQAEQVELNLKELRVTEPVKVSTDAVGTYNSSRHQRKSETRSDKPANSNNSKPTDSQLERPCGRCGYSTHTNGRCPGFTAICKSCNKKGHYTRCCRSKDKSVHDVVEKASESEPEPLFLGSIDDSKSDKSWMKYVQVSHVKIPVRFKLDSGADVSIIPQKLCPNVPLKVCNKVLSAAGNTTIRVIGCFDANLHVDNKSIVETLYVVDQSKALLSRSACVKLDLIQCTVKHQQLKNK